jgi:hypothetical protein
MITNRLTDNGVLIVQPSGPLTKEDFTSLAAEVDAWLEEGGVLKGLLIDAPEFPGWKDFGGLQSHLKFVRNHQRELPRVAVVSDSGFLSALPKVARHFIQAELRRFEAGKTEEALAWIESPREEPAQAIRHAWFPNEKVMWISVNGKISTEEYNKLLGGMEDILQEFSPISFLIDLDDMEGVELGAMVADMKFGFTHLKHFRRIALVGDEKWCHRLASMPNPFPIKLKAFDEGHENEAWDWLQE